MVILDGNGDPTIVLLSLRLLSVVLFAFINKAILEGEEPEGDDIGIGGGGLEGIVLARFTGPDEGFDEDIVNPGDRDLRGGLGTVDSLLLSWMA